MHILHSLTLGIGIIGVAVIVWGVLASLKELIVLECYLQKGIDKCRKRETIRHHLGSYLLLGLEYLIAADIVNTIVKPSLSEIIILGAIVAIRTVLNYSLNKELFTHSHPTN
jgi:uncharacterized membrane protein